MHALFIYFLKKELNGDQAVKPLIWQTVPWNYHKNGTVLLMHYIAWVVCEEKTEM